MYWLDLGYNASSGQFILGQPKNSANKRKGKCRLPTVSEPFPEIARPNRKDEDEAMLKRRKAIGFLSSRERQLA